MRGKRNGAQPGSADVLGGPHLPSRNRALGGEGDAVNADAWRGASWDHGERQVSPHASTVVTVVEAANYLRLGRSKLYQLMEEGEIPYYRVGGRRRIAWSDLEAYLARHRVG